MRRTAVVLLGVATLALAACGGDDAAEDTTPELSLAPVTRPDDVTAPSVDTPDEAPTELQVTELSPGTGPEAVVGNVLLVDYVGVVSSSGEQFDTSYGRSPYPVRLGDGNVIAGWEQGLLGAQAGARLQLDIPSDLAYGDQDYGEVIKAGDALTFVIDVRAVIPPNDLADEPTADDFPLTTEPASELVTTDVVVGEGTTAEAGMTAFVNYVMVRADNGVVLEDTWGEKGVGSATTATTTSEAPATTEPTETTTAPSTGDTTDSSTDDAPATTEAATTTTVPVAVDAGVPDELVLVPGQRIPGFIDGIIGMKVGGRRVIQVPFDQAYGPEGRPTMGLPAETDLMIFVELVAAY